MEDKLNELKARQLKLKHERVKCEDTIQQLELDKSIAKLEIEIIDLLNPPEYKKIFVPQKSNNIKAVSLEKVGLNYIPFIKGAYNVLAGRGGSGKTAIAIKSMIMWLNDNPSKNALAFLTEDGIEEINMRISTICRTSCIDEEFIKKRIDFITLDNDDRIKWATTSRDGYNINDEYIDSVIKHCVSNSIEYIILDPLKRFHRLNENSNDDMDVLVRDVFTKIAVETNAILVVLHHSAKSSDGGARGAGTITDSARMAWKIGRFYIKDKDTHEMIENPTKKGMIKLEVIKDNMGIEKFCTIRDESLGINNPLNGKLEFNINRNSQPIESVFQSVNELDYNDSQDIPIDFL